MNESAFCVPTKDFCVAIRLNKIDRLMSAMSREVKSSLREHECSQMCTCIYTLSSRGEKKKSISGRQTHKMRVRHLHYYVATFI